MKKTLSILLAVALCFTMFATFVGAEDVAGNALAAFTDAPATDSWKHAGLVSAVENNIMKGDNGEIRPDDNLTRAELTAMMVRVLGAQNDKADIAHLVDVAIDAWYTDYIKSGVATKIITGSGNKMMPNDPVTREQAFAILARTFVLAAESHDTVNTFDDAHHVSDWAKDATAALIEKKVVQGGNANDIRPKDNVTRAEYAAMLDRIVGEYAKPGKSYAGQTIKGSIVITDPDVDLTGAIIEGDVIIADSLGGKEVAIKDAAVGGDLVVRAGNVTVSGETSVGKVVYGNPVHSASVKAEDNVKADKVVVTENATEVKNEISAEKVEVSSSDANVTLGGNTEYKDVAIEGSNTEVKVEEGAKVENVVANGSSNTVSGSGSVGNAVVNGEGTKVETPNTNVTDNTPVAPPATGDDDKPSTDKEDDKEDDKPITGGNKVESSVPTPSKPTTPAVTNSYIKYGSSYIYDSNAASNVVTFDLSKLDDATELDKMYIKTDAKATFAHALATFSSNTELDIAEIVNAIPGKTHNVLVEITDTATVMSNLRALVADAYTEYNRNVNGEFVFRPLFTDRKITVVEENGNVKSSFTGLLGGNETFTLEIITKK